MAFLGEWRPLFMPEMTARARVWAVCCFEIWIRGPKAWVWWEKNKLICRDMSACFACCWALFTQSVPADAGVGCC